MAQPFQMADHRNARLFLNPRDEALAAARHHHIHLPAKPSQHVADGDPVTRVDQLHGIGRQARLDQCATHRFGNRTGRVQAFRPTA